MAKVMAMIRCLECGRMISDSARSCVGCGFPINFDKTVKILFPIIPTKLMLIRSKIEAYVDGKLVYSGGQTQEVCSFEIEQRTKIVIKIQRWEGRDFVFEIEPGKRYQLVVKIMNIGLGLDISLNEVDIIDTERR